jgi:hypothetical protein
MKIHRTGLAVAAIVAALGFAAQPLHALDTPRLTVFSVTDPIRVGDTTLNAGTYAIRVVNYSTNVNVLQVTDKDLQQVYATFMAVQRPIPDSSVSSQGTLYFDDVQGKALFLRSWDLPSRSFGYDIATRAPGAPAVATIAVKGSPLVRAAK